LIKTIVDKIIHEESRYKLFSIAYKKRSFWAYYRMYFYYCVTKDMDILDASNAKIVFSWRYIKRVFSIFNVFKMLEKKEYFVLEHPRGNSDNKDIYTDEYTKMIGRDKCAFFSFSQNGTVRKSDEVIVLDLLKIVSKVISKFLYVFIKVPSHYSSFLDTFTQIDKDKYTKQYRRYYLEYICQYYFYRYLLKMKKTQKVLLVVSYYNMPLIAAAKNLQIHVTEFQHGVISPYHLGYHFPNLIESNFFPDRLITFSPYWKDVVEYPKNVDIISLGNSYLSLEKMKIEKTAKSILIISQTTIGKKLETFLLNNIDDLSSYQIYFKLHPNEFVLKARKYKALTKYININVVTDEWSITELQNICEYQIGIYSTAIYEGIEKECKTILLKDTGIEYMKDLINKNSVIVTEYNIKIIPILEKASKVKNMIFFDSFDSARAEELIDG